MKKHALGTDFQSLHHFCCFKFILISAPALQRSYIVCWEIIRWRTQALRSLTSVNAWIPKWKKIISDMLNSRIQSLTQAENSQRFPKWCHCWQDLGQHIGSPDCCRHCLKENLFSFSSEHQLSKWKADINAASLHIVLGDLVPGGNQNDCNVYSAPI